MINAHSSLIAVGGILFIGVVLPVLACALARLYYLVRYGDEFRVCLDAINREDSALVDFTANTHRHFYLRLENGNMMIASRGHNSILDID